MTSNIVPFLWCRERKQKWKQKHYITDCATILKISFYHLLYQPKCRSNITTVTRWYNFYIVTLSYHTVTICHIYDKNTMSHTTSNTRENSSILKMTNVCTSNVTRCDTAMTNHKKFYPVSQFCDEIWMLVFSTTCEWLWKKTNFSRNDVEFFE